MLQIAIVVLLILLNGLFAMAETALVSSRKARLRQRRRCSPYASIPRRLSHLPGSFEFDAHGLHAIRNRHIDDARFGGTGNNADAAVPLHVGELDLGGVRFFAL